MLDTRRPELYTKVHSNTDNHLFYCMSWHDRRTPPLSTTDIKPEMLYRRFGAKVICKHNSPKSSIQAVGGQREVCASVPSWIRLCSSYPVKNVSFFSLRLYFIIIIHLMYIYVAMKKIQRFTVMCDYIGVSNQMILWAGRYPPPGILNHKIWLLKLYLVTERAEIKTSLEWHVMHVSFESYPGIFKPRKTRTCELSYVCVHIYYL